MDAYVEHGILQMIQTSKEYYFNKGELELI